MKLTENKLRQIIREELQEFEDRQGREVVDIEKGQLAIGRRGDTITLGVRGIGRGDIVARMTEKQARKVLNAFNERLN